MVHYQFEATFYLKGASFPFYACHGWLSDLRKVKSKLRQMVELHGAYRGCLTVSGKFSLRYENGVFTKELDNAWLEG